MTNKIGKLVNVNLTSALSYENGNAIYKSVCTACKKCSCKSYGIVVDIKKFSHHDVFNVFVLMICTNKIIQIGSQFMKIYDM